MRVLVVDDEIRNAELVALKLRDAGHQAEFVNGSEPAIRMMAEAPFDAVITDLRMKGHDGLELARRIRSSWPGTFIAMMTAYGDLEVVVRAINEKLLDFFVPKEFEFQEQLRLVIDRAARERSLEATVDSIKKGLMVIVGEAPATRAAVELARKVAAADATVLLRGESGSGKDLFARAIHYSSRRAAGPWVKVNCGALPENLLESELFGHERGAFTGAVRQKSGRFEDAHGGTIFLDEIGELPMSLQVKLLQVIEEKTFLRVGGNQPVTVDVRILAATNRDLEAMVKERQFREDLFFRLNVFPIRLPALRERAGDIPRLVEHCLRRHGITVEKVTLSAMQALVRHPWPGNVRELENALERAKILAGSDPIDVEHLSFAVGPAAVAGEGGGRPWVPRIPPEGLSLEELERELIVQALEIADGNKSRAARLLGLTRRTLYSRMERHGLRKPGEGEEAAEDEVAPAGGEGRA